MPPNDNEVWQLVREITQPTRKRAKLSVPQIAAKLHEKPVMIYKWGEPDSKHRFPADLVADLTLETEDTLLIEWLCGACGGVFTPVARGLKPQEVGRACKEFGELVSDVGEALEDKHVSTSELARVRKSGHEAIAAIQGMILELEALAAAAKPKARKLKVL